MNRNTVSLTVGQTVRLLENGRVVDRGLVRAVRQDGHPAGDEVTLESLECARGTRSDFVFIPSCAPPGWRLLFVDPFTGQRCFSRRAPAYAIEPE